MRKLSIALGAVILLVLTGFTFAESVVPVDIGIPTSGWSYNNGVYSASDSTRFNLWSMSDYYTHALLIPHGNFIVGSSFNVSATFSTSPTSLNTLSALNATLNFTGVTSTSYGTFGTLAAGDSNLLKGTFDLQTGTADLLFGYSGGSLGAPGWIEVLLAPKSLYVGMTGTTTVPTMPLSATSSYNGLAVADVYAVPLPAPWQATGVFLMLIGIFAVRSPVVRSFR